MNSIKRYTNKDNIEVRAIKYNGYNWGEVNDFITGEMCVYPSWIKYYGQWEATYKDCPFIITDGEYVVRYNDGEMYKYPGVQFEHDFKEMEQ